MAGAWLNVASMGCGSKTSDEGASDESSSSASATTDTGNETRDDGGATGVFDTDESTGGTGGSCHPLEDDCAAGEGCYPDVGGTLACADEGNVEHGAKCETSSDCVDGLYCAASIALVDCSPKKCCTSFCDLDQPDCLDGEYCNEFFQSDNPPPGLENLGICVAA